MKLKEKSPKAKLRLPCPPTIVLIGFLCFIVGLSHFLSGPRSGSTMLPGETRESFVASSPFQVLSWKPRAVYYPGFATMEQCETMIKRAEVQLTPSTLALRKPETVESTKGIRTSSGTFISASQDETGVLDIIEKKIARATMLPRNHGEPFNVLRYEIGQKNDSHYDEYTPSEYGEVQKSQRYASFLLYLSDVEEGGETMFPYENGSNMDDIRYDFKKCIGLKIKPRQGDGLVFYSVFPNGTIDETSLHGSCVRLLDHIDIRTQTLACSSI